MAHDDADGERKSGTVFMILLRSILVTAESNISKIAGLYVTCRSGESSVDHSLALQRRDKEGFDKLEFLNVSSV